MAGLWLWSGNKGPFIPREVTWFSMPKEGMAKVQEDRDHVNRFLIGKMLSIMNMPRQAKQLIRNYLNVFRQLRDAIWQKLLQLWATGIGSFITTTRQLVHHLSCRVLWATSNHQGDSAPTTAQIWHCDFWLFPKLKSLLKGKRFQTLDKTQENKKGQLMAIPTKDFAECFEQWKRCWENCMRSHGAYFEGDWDIIGLCTMFLVSCIFFNKCLYFS